MKWIKKLKKELITLLFPPLGIGIQVIDEMDFEKLEEKES